MELDLIREVQWKWSRAHTWQKGDLLVLDNQVVLLDPFVIFKIFVLLTLLFSKIRQSLMADLGSCLQPQGGLWLPSLSDWWYSAFKSMIPLNCFWKKIMLSWEVGNFLWNWDSLPPAPNPQCVGKTIPFFPVHAWCVQISGGVGRYITPWYHACT